MRRDEVVMVDEEEAVSMSVVLRVMSRIRRDTLWTKTLGLAIERG